MSKKSIFLCSALLVAGAASAQKLAEGYVVFPQSTSLSTYVSAWNGGSGTITIDGKTWEDEEFFTSRVKPKERFYNTTTQIYSNLTQYSSSNQNATDKRYLNWVPIGTPDFNALPNAVFDSEAFSMWSYVDHYGNWTMPYGWVIGAAADAAHKNGVAMSGVASIPYGSIPTDWANQLNSIGNLTSDEVGKFLYYHGVDGLGYNSEFSGGGSIVTKIRTLHNGLYSYMSTRNPIFENVWYGGTNDNGSIAFDTGLSSNQGIFKGSSIFLNYNWNNSTYYSTAPGIAKNMGRNPFCVYAGMNQEGSSSDNGGHFAVLKNIQYSIGIWGSHQVNQFWKEHGVGGTTSQAVQKYYLSATEDWYTNVSHNPAIRGTLANIGQPVVRANWAGISASVSARSTLGWNLITEPFYTFFNLGNGAFFNWKGDRVNDNEWYNLGIQDFLPTWRFWFADSWMNKDVSASNVHMSANFTWDDAYVGGSCLRIAGTSSEEYLHLFKTNFAVNSSTKVRLTFKILSGSADISVMLSSSSSTTGQARPMITAADCADIENNSYKEGAAGWTTKEVIIPNRLNTLGVVGLKFANAENLEMLLGGLEIVRTENFAAPTAPQLKTTKILANTYTGIDAKVIWTMDNDEGRNAGTPVYNLDKGVSFFRVYSQEEGGDPQFICATTSWAAIAFRAPNTDSSKKIRFGVSALSLDTKNESDITWSSYMSKGSYVASNDVEVSKKMIKPNEGFSCYYLDSRHSSSTWTLKDNSGSIVASGTGVRLDVPDGLAQGGYDLVLDAGTANERTFGFFVQVSSEEVGALPQVYTTRVGGNEVDENSADVEIDLTDSPTLSYTGRPADGSASRALSLNNHWIGANIGQLGITSTSSVSVGGWFKFNAIPDGEWNFINIVNKNDGWPQNEWGWCWNHGLADGSLEFTFRGNNSDTSQPGELHYSFPNTKIQAGVWTHIMMVFEKDGNAFRCLLYINGVKQKSTWYQTRTGQDKAESNWLYRNKTTDDWCPRISATRADASYVLFGGTVYQGKSIDGICDDFQVWNKAVTEAEVKQSMAGITRSNVPSGLACLWDFETDADSNHANSGFGASPASCYTHEWVNNTSSTEGAKRIETYASSYTPGCPFLSGTAYPVVTEAVWKDSDRKTQFTKAASRASSGEDQSGTATVKFVSAGDHQVSLTLQNNYGSDTKNFPVFVVTDPTQGIEDINGDGQGMDAYTIDNVLFLEFAQDGAYDIEVYNAAGMLVGSQKLNAVAGQNARITLGTPGIYLVKASVNGTALRTLKVLSK